MNSGAGHPDHMSAFKEWHNGEVEVADSLARSWLMPQKNAPVAARF